MDFRDGVTYESQLHSSLSFLEEFGATQVDLKLWRILKAGPILLSMFRNSLLRSTSCHSRGRREGVQAGEKFWIPVCTGMTQKCKTDQMIYFPKFSFFFNVNDDRNG
jgi:hypothetical protein